jgi:2-methylcitrate dehydratase PrpD
MSALTADAARFAAAVQYRALPERCVTAARIGIIDCLGVMIAGSDETATRIVAAMLPASTSNDGAPEIPSGRNLRVEDAALVNGVAAHALDYDDVAMDGHTSAALVPAIFAEGWLLGASGSDAIAAYAAGYEIWALLQEIEPGHLHERGFHPTAIWGTLAAAAACARLHRLNVEETTQAIAIASSLAAGLVANFGTMTKPLHVGRAAQAAVFATRLAKAGFTASPDALEHRVGFMRAHSPSGAPALDVDTAKLGREWRMERLGVNVKRYPTCYATHRSIDAMLGLVAQHDLRPEAVEEIRVRIGETPLLMLRNHEPRTGLEAKFSMEFAMASALIARRVGLKELTDAFVTRPDVADAMRKVRCSTTPETLPNSPFSPDDRVAIALRDGRTLEHPPVAHAKGSWELPLSEEGLRAKFMDCTERKLGRERAERLFDRLREIDRVESLCQLPLTAH